MTEQEQKSRMNRRYAIKLLALGSPVLRANTRCSPKVVGLSLSLAGLQVPTFQNGLLGVVNEDSSGFRLLDLTGSTLHACRITLPGASTLMILDMAISEKGGVVVALTAKDDGGRIASLLALVTPTGDMEKFVRLGNFGSRRVDLLSDGSIVCLGREYDQDFKEIPGHSVLRVYSPDGTLIRKWLPVNALRPVLRSPHPLNWFMSIHKDKILLVEPNGRQYCEVSSSGDILTGPEALPAFDGSVSVNGFAVAENGDRFLGVDPMDVAHNIVGSGKRTGIYRFRGATNSIAGRTKLDESDAPEWVRGSTLLAAEKGNVIALLSPATSLGIFSQEAC